MCHIGHSLALIAALTTWASTGCSSKQKAAADDAAKNRPGGDPSARADPNLCDLTDKRADTFDLNRDGRPDVWKIFKRTAQGDTRVEVMSCKQVDLDHDGRKDYVVAYTDKGAMTYEQFDFDFDGRFDALYQYDEARAELVEIQRDSDFDGRFDLLEVYGEGGGLTSIKRDRNADGEPDLWEQYVDGTLVAILYDDDFDRRVDRREEVAQPSPLIEDLQTQNESDDDSGAGKRDNDDPNRPNDGDDGTDDDDAGEQARSN